MNLTEQHILPKTQEIDSLCFASKNLYNACLYVAKQHFFKTQKYIGFKELSNKIKIQDCYKQLPIKVSQLVVKQVHDTFISFFHALQAYKANQTKFTGRPNIPKYMDGIKGRNVLNYNNQAFSRIQLKKGIINPSGTNLFIRTKQKNIVAVRIMPHTNNICVDIIYTKEEQDLQLNKENILSIDIGIDNFSTITSNKQGFQPLLVKGGVLKSINQFYNKKKAIYQSQLNVNQFESNKIEQLTNKRNRKIKHYLHHVSKFVIDLCIKNDTGTIVIGKNDNWKQNVNIGRRNNQNFVQIPFNTFINQIKYKALLAGINVITREESYTSKCSFLDQESICKHDTYLGKRIKRGLFRSAFGRLINSDVNGSYNIMLKEFPNVVSNNKHGIEGFVVNPMTLNSFRA